MKIEKYEHHGKMVSVQTHLKGNHVKHCLCSNCSKFNPQTRNENCSIANAIYKNCVDYGIVTPVWECPNFKRWDKNKWIIK